MSTKINKRAIPPPRDQPNRPSIEALTVSVNELSGAVGYPPQRAVRVVELLDTGLLEYDVDGNLQAGILLRDILNRLTALEP